MKFFPIDSPYVDKHVVEQRVDEKSHFPREDQLPLILRALSFDFQNGLPGKIARVDRRGRDFDKMQLHTAALMFCSYINAKRSDEIKLHPLLDEDRVGKISIVQTITEHCEGGNLHRFKFYAGPDFFTDLYFNGKALVFSGHALDRFYERVPNHQGTNRTGLLKMVFGGPAVVMKCDSTNALVYNYRDSIVAFPIRDNGGEYFLPTCLSASEITQLEPANPSTGFVPTYRLSGTVPETRNWDVDNWTKKFIKIWQTKSPPPPQHLPLAEKREWSELAHTIREKLEAEGWGPDAVFKFCDDMPGPCTARWRSESDRVRWLENLSRPRPN